MKLEKPASIAASPHKSAKWDEIARGREFSASDAPTLALLCQWHEVVEKCIEDLSFDGEVQIAYENKVGDVKALPQLSAMKQASAEIRALNKQLGIDDGPRREEKKETVFYAIKANREKRSAEAASSA